MKPTSIGDEYKLLVCLYELYDGSLASFDLVLGRCRLWQRKTLGSNFVSNKPASVLNV